MTIVTSCKIALVITRADTHSNRRPGARGHNFTGAEYSVPLPAFRAAPADVAGQVVAAFVAVRRILRLHDSARLADQYGIHYGQTKPYPPYPGYVVGS